MIEIFKQDLKQLSSKQVFRKYMISGPCHILEDDKYFQLREEICERFEIEFSDIILVGSGKLGFSIKPTKRYSPFSDDSDIDIAVVSTQLFQRVWQEAFLYKKSGAYWTSSDIFFRYLSQGWIRPDKLPKSKFFNFAEIWWNFFNKISSDGNYGSYKIRGGLYHSWFFLQEYQKICIEQCIEEMKA